MEERENEYWRNRIDRQDRESTESQRDSTEEPLDETPTQKALRKKIEEMKENETLAETLREAYTEGMSAIKTAAHKSQGNMRECKKQCRSAYKDGWSPSFYAYQINLDMIIEIRRHLMGQYGRRLWKRNEREQQIRQKVDQWEARVKKYFTRKQRQK